MARALLPTTWFTDYWADYRATAQANMEEARDLAEEIGDEDLILDAIAASMHRGGTATNMQDSEELLHRLEERRDPVKLNAHCFWMMWQYSAMGRFADAVATCDRGIALAELIGSAPVQYGSIKAIALTEAGRFDEVDAAIDQEVTDDDHPFGQAMASHARSVFLTRIGAWGPALDSLDDTLTRAEQVSRVWMQYWAGSLMAIVKAYAGQEADLRSAAADSQVFGEWHHGLTGAQVALAEGDYARAIELAMPACPVDGDSPIADHVRALHVVAQAHLAVGDHPAALDAAGPGLGLAELMGFGALIWQLRRIRGLALEGLGDSDASSVLAAADAEFHTLTGRIADPELRRWFERQSLTPTT